MWGAWILGWSCKWRTLSPGCLVLSRQRLWQLPWKAQPWAPGKSCTKSWLPVRSHPTGSHKTTQCNLLSNKVSLYPELFFSRVSSVNIDILYNNSYLACIKWAWVCVAQRETSRFAQPGPCKVWAKHFSFPVLLPQCPMAIWHGPNFVIKVGF